MINLCDDKFGVTYVYFHCLVLICVLLRAFHCHCKEICIVLCKSITWLTVAFLEIIRFHLS